ncbi:uncharacterized protein LOC132045691 [Lycium ferocissimum]|uniref:uncharacterized protein LOC132045691 n=1 Tax=Lycium ferocissimum TaxID=112874 RepID=UPI00281664AA|nr:uncharacterized protein LOC132045691 [Lycium ferocissimum]
MIDDQILLKVSPMKVVIRFGKTGKITLRFIGPLEILRRIGEVAYKLPLPPGLAGVHTVIRVSMLKKHHSYRSCIIQWALVLFYQNLSFGKESVAILDRQVRKFRSKEIASVKVQWKHHPVEEARRETEVDMRRKNHSCSSIQVPSPCFLFHSRMNVCLFGI